MLKKMLYITIFPILVLPLLTTLSCGRNDVSSWPKLILPFEQSAVENIEVSYYKTSSSNLVDFFTDSTDEKIEIAFKGVQAYHYKEKILNSLEIDTFYYRIDIKFNYLENHQNISYNLIWVEYSMFDTYFKFDNGEIHYMYGPFIWVYTDLKS